MSYSLPMTFMNAESKADAFFKANDFARKLVEPGPFRKHITGNLRFFLRKVSSTDKDELDAQIARHLNGWLNKLFTVRCTFWSEYKLMGITGVDWPDECMVLTQGHTVFQNSCDQDYEYSEWPDKIPFFQNCVEEIRAMDDAELCGPGLEPDDIADLGYARRTLLYQTIFDRLDLEHWLYEYQKGTKYEQFAICGIYAGDQVWELYNKARALLLKKI